MSSVRSKCVRFLFSGCLLLLPSICFCENTKPMTKEERIKLREEARDMFYHAYNAYMENAYPADELMPLSCTGRYRGLTPNRGDIDDSLGNFSLTLIDTLDSLVILGDLEEFEHAVKLVINDVTFDNDVVVSVFETNIRVVGGLLSAHLMADLLQQRDNIMLWYKSELLDMAKDIGYRLLPAFNTTTGIPYSRVNLRYGIKSDKLESARETCTACAGSMILEMAALSRLTGEPIFEDKAHKAMDELWKMRHRSSDLMGTVLNVHSGDWVRRDSGVGAGIDSYYEYCLKAYILLGDNKYLNRFNRHYNAVMKYISQGPMLLDVHMHRPHTTSRNFMDALLAFWPGLQVLKGDIKPAVETHEMLYQVMQRHKFIPEAFTTDFQVHWGNHPLRPEFLESTYFLYSATGDPYYLEVGKNVLRSLQKYARVPCGYAAVNDVRTGKQEDRMDSFVLAETFKYLFLLFADKADVVVDLDEFIFTTEGHLFPLTLAGHGTNGTGNAHDNQAEEAEFALSCPNTLKLFPGAVRKPLRNMVDGMCPRRGSPKRLTASEFSASNINHLRVIKDMGINIIALSDGRVQLLHTPSAARSALDAEEGLMFMHEMAELSKLQAQQPDPSPLEISFPIRGDGDAVQTVTVHAGPAQFGRVLKGDQQVTARTVIVQPFRGCEEPKHRDLIAGRIAIMERGDCMFVDKVRRAQKYGAVAAVIVDNVAGSSVASSPMFSMSGDGSDDVTIPSAFLFTEDAAKLLLALSKDLMLELTIREIGGGTGTRATNDADEEGMFHKLKMSVQEFLNKHTGLAFSQTVEAGGFQADIGADKVRITYDASRETQQLSPPPTGDRPNQQWSQIRKGLLKSILHSDNKELYVPLNILRIYYQTLGGTEDHGPPDSVKQTEWLLNEISNEHRRKDSSSGDDSLVKLGENKGVSVLADIEHVTKDEDGDKLKLDKLKRLSSLLESFNQLEDALEQSEALKDVLGKLHSDTTESDDLVVGGADDKKDGDAEQEEIGQTRAADEL
ncbi:ER degradation-enhancing alpha-mannosidase-like protein 3 [Cylas formicarius]|uniref:ER degradation-enhancing alpha-mannosidase-like protein 3 n=1 Tax=Cylas formicarius TaxID=197179 RepID=UPI002958A1AE|nr:ER degradation-enhancing alpha-mannosidase-like protein 3 [Cylas formicarius]